MSWRIVEKCPASGERCAHSGRSSTNDQHVKRERLVVYSCHGVAPFVDTSTVGRFQSPEVRRRQVLDAAARLAVQEGLANTSIAQVAAAAGIAKGSIYLHFGSRQDLLAGLQADLWAQMLERPQEIVDDEALSWAAKLDEVVEHWMRFEFDYHDLYHAVFHAVATDSDEPLEAARTLLGKLIAAGAEAGEFDLAGLDEEIVLEFLLHGYIGPCFHHTDPDTAVADVQQLFRRAAGVTG